MTRSVFVASAIALVGAWVGDAPVRAASTQVTQVRVELLTTPLGIDAPAPRLSWVMTSPERGARQTAYQVLVATSPELLKKGQGDAWDSGKVTSDANAQIAYAGKPLQSRTRYGVLVRAWDGKDKMVSAAPTWFETGVLDPAQWKAQWIGVRAASDDERQPLAGARWLWSTPGANDAAGKRVAFRKTITLGTGDVVRRAELFFAGPGIGRPWDAASAHDLWVNDVKVGHWSAAIEDVHRIDVTAALKAGDNKLAFSSPFAPKQGVIAALVVDLADGRRRVFATDKTWRSQLFTDGKPGDAWRSTPTDQASWTAAADLGSFGTDVVADKPAFRHVDRVLPAIYLRKVFTLGKPIASARLSATSAGVYEMQINGKKVGRDFLTPGWTDYAKRVRYQTYDVTAMLKKGANVVGGIVADGWYAGRTGMGQSLWGFDKALFAELVVTYKDGSRDVIATDPSWRGTTGPQRRADLLDGEEYDSRRELGAWSDAATSDALWRPVVIVDPGVGRLEAQMDPPVRNTETLTTKKVTSPTPGVQIFDLGQNMVGWARVTLKADPGAVVTIRYAEMLKKDGGVFTENLRTARVIDRYVARGRGDETYEPRFTFHGFRYVEVSGHKGTLPASAVTGIVLRSDLPSAGAFATSNKILNQLQSNITWGQRGNFLSIPTDCPQRDERLGWTGDINMFARTASFNMDVEAFLSKYLVDLDDGQHADGSFPDVAPTTSRMGGGAFGWADVGVFLPWLLYQVYGDVTVLEKHYAAAKRWVDHRTSRAKDDLNTDGGFGDWVSPPPQTPNKVLSPMYHAHAAELLAKMARVLGKTADAEMYEALTARIKRAFNQAFVKPDGTIESDTQTAYIIALRYDMLPEALRPAAASKLVAAIGRFTKHLNTGFLGTGNLLPALSTVGRNDLAYDLLLQDTYPSWLFTVKNGATTMWERWDSYTPEGGPSNKGDMNSYNHYAFGSVGEWMYAHAAGLDFDPLTPGWKRVVIRPVVGGGLTSARADYDSVRGHVAARWSIVGKTLSLDVEVPVHATARVFVPTKTPDAVNEGGQRAASAPGVKAVAAEPAAAIFDVGAGRYHFTATAP